jgi:hypothetical protein
MSLLKEVTEIDNLLRQLQKMESKLRSGQIIDAWRELCRIMALLNTLKENLIKEAELKNGQ